MQPLWRLGVYGVVLAAIWVAAVWLNETTLHFAPLLVAALVPLGVALAAEPPSFPRRLAGAAVALAATAVLALSGHLDGPSLLPSGGAVAEAVAFSLAGAVIGLVLGMARRRGG